MNVCPCSRPTELFLCNECVNGLLKDLRGVPDLIQELTVTGAKLDEPAQEAAEDPQTAQWV